MAQSKSKAVKNEKSDTVEILKTKDLAKMAKTSTKALRKWLRGPERFDDKVYTRYAFGPNDNIVKAAIAHFNPKQSDAQAD